MVMAGYALVLPGFIDNTEQGLGQEKKLLKIKQPLNNQLNNNTYIKAKH
jgi:hypothetical protein